MKHPDEHTTDISTGKITSKNMPTDALSAGEFLIYTTDNGHTRIDVRLLDKSVWLTQKQIAQIFQKDVRTINEHIQNILQEGEVVSEAVTRNFRITANDGKKYNVAHYNLDMIISIGYRVKSNQGTQFRIWATERLREYLIKGFMMNDERVKKPAMSPYFDELLQRIRKIRASEKLFYQKVKDIDMKSIDYDKNSEQAHVFLKQFKIKCFMRLQVNCSGTRGKTIRCDTTSHGAYKLGKQ